MNLQFIKSTINGHILQHVDDMMVNLMELLIELNVFGYAQNMSHA